MEKRHDWPKSITAALIISVLLYSVMAISGYVVYGEYLLSASNILGAIGDFDPSTHIYIRIASCIMVLHLMMAFPIVINPVFQKVERIFSGSSDSSDEKVPLVEKTVNSEEKPHSFIMPVRSYLIRLAIAAPVMLAALFVRKTHTEQNKLK
jgi:ABC-type Fe3+-siderophore transport system permease subunit